MYDYIQFQFQDQISIIHIIYLFIHDLKIYWFISCVKKNISTQTTCTICRYKLVPCAIQTCPMLLRNSLIFTILSRTKTTLCFWDTLLNALKRLAWNLLTKHIVVRKKCYEIIPLEIKELRWYYSITY